MFSEELLEVAGVGLPGGIAGVQRGLLQQPLLVIISHINWLQTAIMGDGLVLCG